MGRTFHKAWKISLGLLFSLSVVCDWGWGGGYEYGLSVSVASPGMHTIHGPWMWGAKGVLGIQLQSLILRRSPRLWQGLQEAH